MAAGIDLLAAEDDPDRLARLDRTGEVAVLGLVGGVFILGVAVHQVIERLVGQGLGDGMPGDRLGQQAAQRPAARVHRLLLGHRLEAAGVLVQLLPDAHGLDLLVHHDHPARSLSPYCDSKASCKSLGVTCTLSEQSFRRASAG